MSSVLSPFIVVLNVLAFGCILNFWLTFYTLMRYRSYISSANCARTEKLGFV